MISTALERVRSLRLLSRASSTERFWLLMALAGLAMGCESERAAPDAGSGRDAAVPFDAFTADAGGDGGVSPDAGRDAGTDAGPQCLRRWEVEVVDGEIDVADGATSMTAYPSSESPEGQVRLSQGSLEGDFSIRIAFGGLQRDDFNEGTFVVRLTAGDATVVASAENYGQVFTTREGYRVRVGTVSDGATSRLLDAGIVELTRSGSTLTASIDNTVGAPMVIASGEGPTGPLDLHLLFGRNGADAGGVATIRVTDVAIEGGGLGVASDSFDCD